MTLPKKKGIRQIQVDTISYYWIVQTNDQTIRIRIGEVANPNHNFLVEAVHIDPWLQFRDKEPQQKKSEIEVITPNFIRKAIEFALANQWDAQLNSKMQISYANGDFAIKS